MDIPLKMRIFTSSIVHPFEVSRSLADQLSSVLAFQSTELMSFYSDFMERKTKTYIQCHTIPLIQNFGITRDTLNLLLYLRPRSVMTKSGSENGGESVPSSSQKVFFRADQEEDNSPVRLVQQKSEINSH